jgi:hypothetical protein
MSDDLTINEVEVQRVNLQPNDVLMVTVNHEDITEHSIEQLREKLKVLFPTNKVMLFAMGPEGYVKFTVATQSEKSYCDRCTAMTALDKEAPKTGEIK